jgi:hypothetical protein
MQLAARLGTYNKETERAVMLSVDPVGPHGWRDGQGFLVTIYFTALKSDRGRIMVTPENFTGILLMAQATILPAR